VKLSNYTEEDSQRAFAKLTEAATLYDRNSAATVNLYEFECESMPTGIFKDQLKRVFNITLSHPELSALITHFDKDHTESINCQEFLIQFFRTGVTERARIHAKQLAEHQRRQQRDIEWQKTRRLEQEQRAAVLVDFNFSEAEFDSALTKFITLCYRLDRRHFGSQDMKAFEIDSLTSSEFRELMKRTFNFRVTPLELGALVKLFDLKENNHVSCNLFMQIFTSTRLKTQEFKGKVNELQLLDEHHKMLKNAYKTRLKSGTDKEEMIRKKPWRSGGGSDLALKSEKGKPVRQRKPYPTTPLQKLKRRLTAAKHTSRLDLSSQIMWGGRRMNKPTVSEITNQETVLNPDLTVTETDNSKISEEPETTSGNKRTVPQTGVTESVPLSKHIMTISDPPVIDLPNTDKHCQEINVYLISIPDEVFQMQGLTQLWLSHNALTTVPTQIVNLKNLMVLCLQDNNLSQVPNAISQLVKLERIYLQNNQLTSLPDSWGRLNALVEIDLSHNDFKMIPNCICRTGSLQILNIAHNNISTVPFAISELRSLIILNISGNPQIKEAPIVLEKLYWIHLIGCPLPVTRLAPSSLDHLLKAQKDMEAFVKHKALKRVELGSKSKSSILSS